MKKIFTSLLVALAFCTAIIAAVQKEMHMHVFQNGDKGESYYMVKNVDSVKFTIDTLEYKVSFVNWDGTELQSGILQSGSMPEYKGEENPTREQTAKYTYGFKGWTPEIEEVQSEATYTAVYDSTIRKYLVLAVYTKGAVVAMDSFYYGTMPILNNELLTLKNDKRYYYSLIWYPALTEVTGNAVYTVDVSATKHIYTHCFVDYNGLRLYDTEGDYDYVWTEKPTREENSDYYYVFTKWSRDESQIEEDTLIYTAVYDSFLTKKDGAIRAAAYKVSETDSVYFSQGNLQFNAEQEKHITASKDSLKGTWRFAENQYDYIGSTNKEISETYDGWIDLFGWGTSGWDSKTTCYQPWSTTEKNSYYHPGGSYSNNLTGDYANADWGVYNAISNGGNEPNKWRTLTISEWQYLFKNNKWTLGYINDSTNSYVCFMLIPETFTAPEGTTVTVISTTTTSFYLPDLSVPSTNKYTIEEFASLEKLGVVALPCGGVRKGSSISHVGFNGNYWSSSAFDSNYALGLDFYNVTVSSNSAEYRCHGLSVRLVQDVQ